MRFLFRDAESGQEINNRFRLDLQFAGQLVDSDLIRVAHSSFGYSGFAFSVCSGSL
jgi:hypothetical protein